MSRSLFVDLEPTVVDSVRASSYSDVYDPESLINGQATEARNFASAQNSDSIQLLDDVLDRIH